MLRLSILFVVWRVSIRTNPRPRSRINTDWFPKQAPKVQASRRSGGMLHQEIIWILTPQSPLSWVSESFRQDIYPFHSPRMNPCKSVHYFIMVNFHVVLVMEQDFNVESFFFYLKYIYSLWKIWPISVKWWKATRKRAWTHKNLIDYLFHPLPGLPHN